MLTGRLEVYADWSDFQEVIGDKYKGKDFYKSAVGPYLFLSLEIPNLYLNVVDLCISHYKIIVI